MKAIWPNRFDLSAFFSHPIFAPSSVSLCSGHFCNVIAASFTCSTCIVLTMRNYFSYKPMWWSTIPHSLQQKQSKWQIKFERKKKTHVNSQHNKNRLFFSSSGASKNIFNDCSNLHRNIIVFYCNSQMTVSGFHSRHLIMERERAEARIKSGMYMFRIVAGQSNCVMYIVPDVADTQALGARTTTQCNDKT